MTAPTTTRPPQPAPCGATRDDRWLGTIACTVPAGHDGPHQHHRHGLAQSYATWPWPAPDGVPALPDLTRPARVGAR